MVVVVANPAVQAVQPGAIRGVELGVGPLAQHRLNESLGLAVGLGSAAAGELVFGSEVLHGISEVEAVREGHCVVGHDALNPDATIREEGRRVDQESGGRATL